MTTEGTTDIGLSLVGHTDLTLYAEKSCGPSLDVILSGCGPTLVKDASAQTFYSLCQSQLTNAALREYIRMEKTHNCLGCYDASSNAIMDDLRSTEVNNGNPICKSSSSSQLGHYTNQLEVTEDEESQDYSVSKKIESTNYQDPEKNLEAEVKSKPDKQSDDVHLDGEEPGSKDILEDDKKLFQYYSIPKEHYNDLIQKETDLNLLPEHVAKQYVATLVPLSDTHISSVVEIQKISAVDLHFTETAPVEECQISRHAKKEPSLHNILMTAVTEDGVDKQSDGVHLAGEEPGSKNILEQDNKSFQYYSISNEPYNEIMQMETDLLVPPEDVAKQYVATLVPLPDTHTSSVVEIQKMSDVDLHFSESAPIEECQISRRPKKEQSLHNMSLWGL